MSAHTEGPWRYVDGCIYAGPEHGGLRILIAIPTAPKNIDHPSPEICSPEWDALNDINDANARLIAASPDLLAAVKAIVFQVRQGKVLERDACITQACAAIAKATDKPKDPEPTEPPTVLRAVTSSDDDIPF